MMLKDDFVKWLEAIGAEYQDCSEERKQDCIFVFGKDEAIKKKENPRKYKDLYVPYIILLLFYHYTTTTRKTQP